MGEPSPRQPQLGEIVLNDEQLAEITRLQHGIATIDLLSKEVELEDRRQDFLWKTRPGSVGREEILNGPAYKGDELKLAAAINKATGRFAVDEVRRQSMVELASFLGIKATIEDRRVVTESSDDWPRLSKEYAKWRVNYAGRRGQQNREAYRDFLEAKIIRVSGNLTDEPAYIRPGPTVSLEERAILLTRAINAMAHRSMLSGLGIGVADEQYNEEIYERYQENTPVVDSASLKKVDRLLKAAKRDFWQASGFPAIRRSGSMNERLLERRAHKMWKEFAGQFEHALQQRKRVVVRKKLREYIPDDRLPETSIDEI